MRITRLELHGFKSFADRTVLHLGSGISCVVGPNGCGKSNVVDAIKWVIGEQSAKSLRGGEMQDVIFAGSAERKPVGYAEVALVLSAEGGAPFPGDYARYAEVQVARRLYRSGVSEYLVNQTKVRRKDVLDLFMDTGVGNDLYSFIEQGRIDKIVGASTEEVRGLVDEAAGITRYKKRRDEAQSKLEATGGQLDRAADVADEMARRLRALERQVIAAARFRRLRALLRQDEVLLALAKHEALSGEGVEDEGALVARRARLAELEGSFLVEQEDLALRDAELGVVQEEVERARDALAEADAGLREAQAAATLHADRARELVAEVERLVAEVEVERGRGDEAEAALTASLTAAGTIEAELEAATRQAGEARAAEGAAAQAERAASEILRVAEAASTRAASERSVLHARLEALEARARELPERLRAVRTLQQDLAGRREVAEKRLRVALEALAARESERGALEGRRTRVREDHEARTRQDLLARDAVRAAELELDAVQRELAEAAQRAETTAGQAEEEVALRVARLEQQLDLRAREADKVELEGLAASEARERRSLGEEEARRRDAVEAERREEDRALVAWRAEAERAFEAEEARRTRADDGELAAARQRAETEASEGRAAARARADAAREARDAGERKVSEAAQALRDAEARQAVATQRLRVAEQRLAVLEAELAARAGRDAGARAVRDALGEPPALAERLTLPPEDRAWLAIALGDRLWLPVVEDAKVKAAAAAASEAGRARVVLDPGGSVERALGGAVVEASLEEALARHRREGGAVVVRGTGERIDADGVLTLGQPDDAGEGLAAVEEADALRGAMPGLSRAVSDEDGAVLAARAKLEGARIAARRLATELDAVEQHGLDAVEAAASTARAALEARARELREARLAWRQEARAALEAEVKARAEARDGADAARRAALDAWLAERQGALAEAHDEARRSQTARSTERREAASAELEAGRAAAWEEVRAQTADVAVVRERLRSTAQAARERLDEVRRKAERVARELEAARGALAAADREASEADVVLARLAAEREAAAGTVASLDERLAAVAEEASGLEASLADVASRAEVTRAELAALVEASQAAEAEAEAARGGLAAAHAATEAARASRADLEAREAALGARKAASAASGEAARTALASAAQRQEALRGRLADAELRRAEAVRQGHEAAVVATERGAARDAAAAAWEHERTRSTALREAREEAARRVRALEAEVTELRRVVLEAEAKTQAADQERAALRARLEERYQLDLLALLATLRERDAVLLPAGEEARAGFELGDRVVEPVEDRLLTAALLRDEVEVKAAVERSAELRAQLQRLGEVHLGALDEYRELEARWSELEAQRADLDASVHSIREAIAKINRTCRERFVETFEQVDAAFRKAYPELVGGGEARLQLTDAEDLLETGVEIFVRPPGKRLQSLSLLSGGEKAMTAIALLLALFSVKPSPFCVLDEVDAPLDEANGARFNEMLRRMAETTQFLVVTHNRKTMECADTLYGITMPTAGCSALVSVRVD